MLFINEAMAATTAPTSAQAAHNSGYSAIIMLIVFVALIYFMIWRPQSKRAKDQRNLINSISVGDEVITAGGIVGRVTKVEDHFFEVEIAANTIVRIQRNSVSSVLPKGTMKKSDTSS